MGSREKRRDDRKRGSEEAAGEIVPGYSLQMDNTAQTWQELLACRDADNGRLLRLSIQQQPVAAIDEIINTIVIP